MSTDNREDYLINILRLTEGEGTVKTTELAHFMNVSPASVSEMLKVLQKDGMVNYQKYKGVSLTEEGIQNARALRRKHHIMERFLTDVLDIDHEQAHSEACAMEHSISDDAVNKMCRMMGTKVSDDCETCTNPCEESKKIVKPSVELIDMNIGTKGVISHLSNDDVNVIKKLISLGFVPGREVEYVSKMSDKGTRIIKVGQTTVALDLETASSIYIN